VDGLEKLLINSMLISAVVISPNLQKSAIFDIGLLKAFTCSHILVE
jgi:hypothetical protein